jgi:hypothetical protein
MYTMPLGFVTTVGNKRISEGLKGMLVDLRDTIGSAFENIEDRIEKINIQARSEGFKDHEINLLIRMYLSEVRQLSKRQIKYLLTDKPRIKEQKSLIEKRDNFVSDASVLLKQEEKISIPTDYDVVIPDQVLEEVTQDQQQQQQPQEEPSSFEKIKKQEPDYTLVDLRSQVEDYKCHNEELTSQYKIPEEKYEQLEAKTKVSPTTNIPTVQGNTLKTKVVVTQLFREVLALKGSKMIYANVVIDISQNKYVRLEPLFYTTSDSNLNNNTQKKDRN